MTGPSAGFVPVGHLGLIDRERHNCFLEPWDGRMGKVIHYLVVFTALGGSLAHPASAAPPASCVGKFVGTWSYPGGTTTVRPNGLAYPHCAMCVAVQTWTCQGNTYQFSNSGPPGQFSATLIDSNHMQGSGGVATRIGGAAIATSQSNQPDRAVAKSQQAAAAKKPPTTNTPKVRDAATTDSSQQPASDCNSSVSGQGNLNSNNLGSTSNASSAAPSSTSCPPSVIPGQAQAAHPVVPPTPPISSQHVAAAPAQTTSAPSDGEVLAATVLDGMKQFNPSYSGPPAPPVQAPPPNPPTQAADNDEPNASTSDPSWTDDLKTAYDRLSKDDPDDEDYAKACLHSFTKGAQESINQDSAFAGETKSADYYEEKRKTLYEKLKECAKAVREHIESSMRK